MRRYLGKDNSPYINILEDVESKKLYDETHGDEYESIIIMNWGTQEGQGEVNHIFEIANEEVGSGVKNMDVDKHPPPPEKVYFYAKSLPIMQSMGHIQDEGLGKDNNGNTHPIQLERRPDRIGLGDDVITPIDESKGMHDTFQQIPPKALQEEMIKTRFPTHDLPLGFEQRKEIEEPNCEIIEKSKIKKV